MALTDLETKWVKRAHRMLNDEEHIERTRDLGGSPAGLEPDPRAAELRWPGYLGPDAVPGEAVLMIANIHRNFGSAGLSAPTAAGSVGAVRDLLEGTHDFKRLERTGISGGAENYLGAVRRAYEAGLVRGGWDVGAHFGKALAACSKEGAGFSLIDELRRAVYINSSCAQLPGASSLTPPLAHECLRRHRLKEVLELVRPRAILCSSPFAFEHIVALEWDKEVPTVCFHQWRNLGHLTRSAFLGSEFLESKTPPAAWLTALRNATGN